MSFTLTGLAKLLEGYESDLPATCGLGGAVSGLIEGVQSQLPKIRNLISTHEEKISCAVQSVVSSSFSPTVGCVVPSIERTRPHLSSSVNEKNRGEGDEEEDGESLKIAEARLGPMIFPYEGELRSDVIGGIYQTDTRGASSVGTFEESSRKYLGEIRENGVRKDGKFYQGYEYFATLLRKLDGLY